MFINKSRIYFNQVDPGGILFYGEVFNIVHCAYEDMFNGFNLGVNYFEHPEFAVPIIHTEADYLKPIKLGDEIITRIIVSELKTSSFSLEYEVQDIFGNILVKVKTVHVFVRKKGFSKTELPTELRNKLSDLYFAK
ncbi:1,4-dihydroxy-2-naphthoyl-CoA hydrolase [bacterium BMS3Abin04]|nr:1,4-dihydroxy-2-naphthoyl-CoA hydrolase [bacterium BMS3Abin04]